MENEKTITKTKGMSVTLACVLCVALPCLTALLICAVPFVFTYFLIDRLLKIRLFSRQPVKTKQTVVQDKITQAVNFYMPDYKVEEQVKKVEKLVKK
jgi:hypothetical protein